MFIPRLRRASQLNSLILSRSIATFLQVRHQTTVALSEKDVNLTSKWDQARPFSEIPDGGWRLLRSFFPGGKYYKIDGNKLMVEMKKDYGDIVILPGMFGKKPLLITYNPEDFEQIFRNESIWPNRPGNEALHFHRAKHREDFFQGTEGIIATQDEKWGTFRSAVNPVLMQPKNVRLYFQKMADVNLEFVQRIKDIRDPKTLEVPSSFEEEINRWTLESVSVVALDKQLGLLTENRDNPKATELFKHLTTFFTLGFEIEVGVSMWRLFKTPDFKKFMNSLDGIVEICSSYTQEAIERLKKEKEAGIDRPENEKSVLEKLLGIDEKIATVMAMDMLMAGVDTTSSTFVGLLLCLAQNPDKQEKLREEVFRLLPGKDSNFDENELKNAPYLRACIKESLRMYPLVTGNARTAKKDVVLSGYQVPKETQVFMPSVTLMKNEKYFPSPNEFLPERWLRTKKDDNSETALKLTNPFVYLPFGFGPRMCIGRRIVEMELELGISRILRNFKVEFNHPMDNPFKMLLINVPNIPLHFKFTDIP